MLGEESWGRVRAMGVGGEKGGEIGEGERGEVAAVEGVGVEVEDGFSGGGGGGSDD